MSPEGALPSAAHLARLLSSVPEVSGHEAETSNLLARNHRALGASLVTEIGGHGFAAIYRFGPGPVVWLRGELDAVSVTSVESVLRSSVPKHTCGHHIHSAALVEVAHSLVSQRWDQGTVVVIGQPAEESMSGARRMAKDRKLAEVPPADVLFAQHLAILPEGTVGLFERSATAGQLAVGVNPDSGDCEHLVRELRRVLDPSVTLRVTAYCADSLPPEYWQALRMECGADNQSADGRLWMLRFRSTDSISLQAALNRFLSLVECCTETPYDYSTSLVLPAALSRARSDAAKRHFIESLGPGRIVPIHDIAAADDVAELVRVQSKPAELLYWLIGCVKEEHWYLRSSEHYWQTLKRLPVLHAPNVLTIVDQARTVRFASDVMRSMILSYFTQNGSHPGSEQEHV